MLTGTVLTPDKHHYGAITDEDAEPWGAGLVMVSSGRGQTTAGPQPSALRLLHGQSVLYKHSTLLLGPPPRRRPPHPALLVKPRPMQCP